MMVRERRYDALIEKIHIAFPFTSDHRILDLGCGDGTASAIFASEPFQASVLAIDSNMEMIGENEIRWKQLESRLQFRHGDIGSPDFLEIASFDGLWSSYSLAYLGTTQEKIKETITVWASLIKSGGWLAMTEIDGLFSNHRPLSMLLEFERMERDLWPQLGYDPFAGGIMYDIIQNELSGVLEVIEYSSITEDQELGGSGPVTDEYILNAWRNRWDRLKILPLAFPPPELEKAKSAFFSCLQDPDHSTIRFPKFVLCRKL